LFSLSDLFKRAVSVFFRREEEEEEEDDDETKEKRGECENGCGGERKRC